MPQNVLDTDSFGGTNGDTLTVYNANWVLMDLTAVNPLQIRSTPGVGANSNIGAELRNGFTWTNDQWSELKIDGTTVADTRLLVAVRATVGVSNSSTGYAGGVHRDITGGTYQIFKWGPGLGSFTDLVTGSHSYAVNDVVNLEVVGTTLNLYLNGALEATITDSTYSTGSPGLILGDTTTNRLAGSWRAGSVSTGRTSKNIRPWPLGMALGMGIGMPGVDG